MNHKNLTFIMVIMWPALETCLGFALKTDTITSHWPPKVLKQNINWIQAAAPSPFRKLSAGSLYRTFEEAESPLRTDRKLLEHLPARAAAEKAALHNIDINPYAQSLNAELETAFATVASHAKNNKDYKTTLPVAAADNLNVDQSPTGAAASPADAAAAAAAADSVSLDWHRYFTMDDVSSPFEQHSEPTAAAVYQAKRSREMIFNKSL